MRPDPITSAYGFFQVVFADMADTLADAVFRLRQRTEANLKFEEVFGDTFGRLVAQFRKELGTSDAEDVAALRSACDSMSRLATWRNDRIHARVRMTEDGYALYDWRTRKRLQMTHEDIDHNTKEAFKTKQTIEMYVPNLIVGLDIEADIERLLSTVPDLNAPPED
jgi:hypothetical protein